jgi:outer membrane protein TolC
MGGLVTLITVSAQDTLLTLQECLELAEMNNPVRDQAEYFASSSDLKLKNLNKNYLPEMNINGDVHYQSDVTQVPTVIAQFAPEPLDKDWYKITLDIGQVIYDGSTTKRSKEVETIDNLINLQNVGITLYSVKERVTQAYFSIIAWQENKALLLLQEETLKARLRDVESGVRNGVLLASNADILRAELLKIAQRIDDSDIAIATAYQVLSILIGQEIADGTKLDLTVPEIQLSMNGQDRLEYGLFSLQQQRTGSMKKLSSSKLMPRLMAYGQAGYGRPGFNLLKNQFDDFYVVGAKLSWNFWNWNKTRNEKSMLDLNSSIVASNRDAFTQNISVDLARKQADIARYAKFIEKDRQIADLRTSIMETYSSQLNNGVITSTEYVTELRAETEALLNLKIHQIQLLKAKYDYLATAGKL